MRYACFLMLFLFGSVALMAQNQTVLERVDSLMLNADYEGVVSAVDHLPGDNRDSTAFVILKNRKALALIRLARYQEADTVLSNINTYLAHAAHPSAFLTGVTRANQGFLLVNEGRNDLATDNLEKSLDDFETAGKSESLEAAQALSYLGQVYAAAGKPTQAEQQLQMALTLRSKQLPAHHELIAASLNDLGFVNSFLDNDKALDYYEQALDIYKDLHGNEHPKIAIANTNLGVAYRKIELYGDAVNSFETALNIWEKIYPGPNPSKGFVLLNLGLTYQQMGNLTSALGYYERALAAYRASYGDKHPDIASVLNAIGNIKLSNRKYDEAIATFQEALTANIPDFNDLNPTTNPHPDNYYSGVVMLYSLMYKGQALEARHLGSTLKLRDLQEGLRCVQICDTLIDKLRQQSTNESDKIALGSIANEVYGDGVRIAYTLADESFVKQSYRDQAFYFAEKSKAAVLQDAISESEAKSFANIPSALLEEEKSLKAALALCAQQLAQKPSPQEESYLRETAFNLNRSYEQFTGRLESNYPEYFNLKFNSSSPTIAQLQSRLDEKTALVSYFVDEHKPGSTSGDRLFTFLITNKKFRIFSHSLADRFSRYYTALRNGIFYRDGKTYTEVAYFLYRNLIPGQIPGSITELIVIPTGRMSVVPFEALLTGEVDAGDIHYDALPYLSNRFGITYEFSAGLLSQKKSGTASENPSIYLCAPITFDEKEGLPDLPGTESEVQNIADLFSNKHINYQVSLKEQATESAVKSGVLQQFTLLHFATHGVVDEENPELSRIFLRPYAGEDGDLYSGEIYNLQLNADLVTLSACQTGLGKISKGEGVIGLSRALVYAGAHHIMVSFWSVADKSTARFMENFYDLLLSNNDQPGYVRSLQQAKLNMIRTGTYSEPYFWAPFVLIGK